MTKAPAVFIAGAFRVFAPVGVRAGVGLHRQPRHAAGVLHHHNPARHPARDILPTVEHIFTGLLVLVTIAVMWFAGYVVYRLYSDQR